MVKKNKLEREIDRLLGVVPSDCGKKGVELECNAYDRRSSLTLGRELENEMMN